MNIFHSIDEDNARNCAYIDYIYMSSKIHVRIFEGKVKRLKNTFKILVRKSYRYLFTKLMIQRYNDTQKSTKFYYIKRKTKQAYKKLRK